MGFDTIEINLVVVVVGTVITVTLGFANAAVVVVVLFTILVVAFIVDNKCSSEDYCFDPKQARIIERELRRRIWKHEVIFDFLIDYIICDCIIIFDCIFDYIICDCIFYQFICDCIFDYIIHDYNSN